MKEFQNTLQAGHKLNNNTYVIVEVFGQGLFTITYLASQIMLNRRVIINEFFLKDFYSRDKYQKVTIHGIDEHIILSFRDRWLKEAGILAECCSSEQIVNVIDTFEENNTAYYVTQFIQEKDLRDYLFIKPEKLLTENEANQIIIHIADGLNFIHQHKILHLNLSPSNILIDKSNRPVIIQFGIAISDVPRELLIDPGKLIKPGYSPPEMYEAGEKTGPYSDIYALGAIYYFLLTGKDPAPAYERSNDFDIEATLTSTGVSAFIRRRIVKAMALDPAHRYQYTTDLIMDIKTINPDIKKPSVRWINPVIAAIILILLMITVGRVILRSIKPDKTGLAATLTVKGQKNPAIIMYSTGDTLALADETKRVLTPTFSPDIDSVFIGKFYGLFIGIQNYADPNIKDLKKPLADVQRMADILDSAYVFDRIFVLKDPSRKEIFCIFDSIESLLKNQDNFLLFYAGHGDIDTMLEKGYRLTKNAELDNKAEWISTDDIKDRIALLKARHILVISDACFGGSIMKSAPPNLASYFDQFTLQTFVKKSRTSIASSFGEEVPDRSVFLTYLIDNLQSNKEIILTDEELYYNTLESVRNGTNSNIPKPDRRPITNVGDNGGSFIFIRKNY